MYLTSLLYVSTKGFFPIVKSAIIFTTSSSSLFSYTLESMQNGINSGYFSISKTKFISLVLSRSIKRVTDAFGIS